MASAAEQELARMRAQLEALKKSSTKNSLFVVSSSSSPAASKNRNSATSSMNNSLTTHQNPPPASFQIGQTVTLTEDPQQLREATAKSFDGVTDRKAPASLASRLAYLGSSGTFVQINEDNPRLCVVEFADGCSLELPVASLMGSSDIHDSADATNNKQDETIILVPDDEDDEKGNGTPEKNKKENNNNNLTIPQQTPPPKLQSTIQQKPKPAGASSPGWTDHRTKQQQNANSSTNSSTSPQRENEIKNSIAATKSVSPNRTITVVSATQGNNNNNNNNKAADAAAANCPFPTSRPTARWSAPPPPQTILAALGPEKTGDNDDTSALAPTKTTQQQQTRTGGNATSTLNTGRKPATAATNAADGKPSIPPAPSSTASKNQQPFPKRLAPATTTANGTATKTLPTPKPRITPNNAAPRPSTTTTTSSYGAAVASSPTPSAPTTSVVMGGTKTIKVLENGEYGAGAVPRTVVVKPIFKSLPALKSHVTRELAWQTLGRRVDAIYDAITGLEIKDLSGIAEGTWYVASGGNRMVPIPTGSKLFIEALRGKQEL